MMKLVVLSIVIASVAATPSAIAPLWGGHLAGHWGAAVAAPIAAPLAVAPLAPIGAHNYRGPLSLAPGQPANILAHDGRPLDTLSVNVDRAVHYTAKAWDHGAGHWLKKRSLAAPWAAGHLAAVAPAAAWSHAARIDVPAAAHVIGPAPLAVAGAAHVAPWGLGHGAHLGHHW